MLIKVHGYFAIMIDKMWSLQNITISSSFGSFVDFSDRKHRNDIDYIWGLGYGAVSFSPFLKSTFVSIMSLLRMINCHSRIPGGRLNIKMSSYQHKISHYKDKSVSRQSYLYHGNPYLERTSLYGHGALAHWRIPPIPMRPGDEYSNLTTGLLLFYTILVTNVMRSRLNR